MAIDRGIISNSWAFSKALARGVWDAGSNMVKGLGELAKNGYQLATDASARESAWQTSKQLTEMAQAYGQEVIEDPGKVYRDAADGVSTLYQHYEQAKSEAEAQGRTAEFYGEMTGEAGFEVGSILVPVGLASKAGKLGKATDTLADTAAAANKIENIDEAFAAAQRAEHTALNPAISELDDKISPIQKCPDMEQADGIKTINRRNIIHRMAEEVNSEFPKTFNPPYKLRTRVTEYTTKEADQFVRVHGLDNAVRPWMMRKEAIEGLTPEQIQHKYSLPSKPSFISNISVPAGTRIRTGKVESNFKLQGGGGQGATQYEWLGIVPDSAVTNTRPIN